MIKVTYKDNIYEYPEGILLYEIERIPTGMSKQQIT